MRPLATLCFAALAGAAILSQARAGDAENSAPSPNCSQLSAEIEANKHEITRALDAEDKLTRTNVSDPSVRIAIMRYNQKANDLRDKNAALQMQEKACPAGG
jgi:hypothetical protein